ncbi:DDE-domain-containing protein [Patellaria atrata CBS 101060]|uniref:DDE-domain-containing protein n=1 Tax=Patellaria atrata CBS 101060 TaxID=1346257 RepID=A0A9P4S7L2_9PEZI|nr:DDE-domain-containing protein [Patellaria atrata CBS 101060]
MTPIEAALESLKLQDIPNITQTAKEYNCDRTTLSRRFRNVTVSREVAIENFKLMTEAQSKTPIKYINRLTDPSHIVGKRPGNSWVTRWYRRYGDQLKSGYLSPIDLARHKVDQGPFYKLYFELLGRKLDKFSALPENTYNMDEKGFLIGMLKKSRRIYSKAAFESGRVKGIAQDGNREWITVLATICADGTAIPPGIIYPSGYGPEDQGYFFTASPTGWTNDELGLRWLETVFDRSTKTKAGRAWRLLIVDGHGSHINMPFLEYCISDKIILANYPPHSTHRLQPLDVSLFSPLATYYKKNIPGSFKKTGISPYNPSEVLQGLAKPERQPVRQIGGRPSSSESAKSVLSEKDWKRIEKKLETVVADVMHPVVEELKAKFQFLSTSNTILQQQNFGLINALEGEKRQRKRQKSLLQRVISTKNGGAVFWSPQKITQARDFLRQEEEDEAAEEARKVNNKLQQQLRREEKEEQAKDRKFQRQKDKEERERVAEVKNAQQQITVEAKQAEQKKKQIVILPAIELLDNIIEVVEVETVNPTTGRPRRQSRLPQRF